MRASSGAKKNRYREKKTATLSAKKSERPDFSKLTKGQSKLFVCFEFKP